MYKGTWEGLDVCLFLKRPILNAYWSAKKFLWLILKIKWCWLHLDNYQGIISNIVHIFLLVFDEILSGLYILNLKLNQIESGIIF